jgi:hypothetical protein
VRKALHKTTTATASKAPAFGSVETLLAACWLLVPAIQYLGAMQRTAARLDNSVPGSLAMMDLTPHYLILLIATVTFVSARALRNGTARP